MTNHTRVQRVTYPDGSWVTRNGLDVAFTSPDASNVAMLYSPWREPLADFS